MRNAYLLAMRSDNMALNRPTRFTVRRFTVRRPLCILCAEKVGLVLPNLTPSNALEQIFDQTVPKPVQIVLAQGRRGAKQGVKSSANKESNAKYW